MSWSHPILGYRQNPQQVEVGGYVIHNPTPANLRAAGWHEDQLDAVGPFQAYPAAPSFGTDGIAYWIPEDLPLADTAAAKRDEVEAAHTAAMPSPQSQVNRLLMRSAELAFRAASVGLDEDEADEANGLLILANMVRNIDAHRADLLARIDAALAANDRATLLNIKW